MRRTRSPWPPGCWTPITARMPAPRPTAGRWSARGQLGTVAGDVGGSGCLGSRSGSGYRDIPAWTGEMPRNRLRLFLDAEDDGPPFLEEEDR